ncbi:unnamed protein product [Urochloa humidicola]
MTLQLPVDTGVLPAASAREGIGTAGRSGRRQPPGSPHQAAQPHRHDARAAHEGGRGVRLPRRGDDDFNLEAQAGGTTGRRARGGATARDREESVVRGDAAPRGGEG